MLKKDKCVNTSKAELVGFVSTKGPDNGKIMSLQGIYHSNDLAVCKCLALNPTLNEQVEEADLI